jgi:hypothetical protein
VSGRREVMASPRDARWSNAIGGLVLVAFCVASSAVSAQPSRSANDADIVHHAVLVVSGDHVEIFQLGVSVAPAFLKTAEDAYRQLEALTGRPLDTATLGLKVRIYVADAVTISHVWRGYQHPKDPKGLVFLSPRVYQAALRGTDATYAHEMAHLFTWRYHSHTLREGLADYLALKIHPGAGVGPNADGYGGLSRIPPEVIDHLGTTKPAPSWLTRDPYYRRVYYFASYRFVKYLIDKAGMDVFMKLYDSDSPETEFAKLYGAAREELIRLAGM